MSKVVHFIGLIAIESETSACNIWNPDRMTGALDDVTCKRCRGTHEFLLASAPNAKRSPAYVAYRKPAANAMRVGRICLNGDRER